MYISVYKNIIEVFGQKVICYFVCLQAFELETGLCGICGYAMISLETMGLDAAEFVKRRKSSIANRLAICGGIDMNVKKILSVTATIIAAIYLAAGIALLIFQDVIKPIYMNHFEDVMKVYPIQNILQLLLVGIPCLALGVLSISENAGAGKNADLLLIVYSSLMLVLEGPLVRIGTGINNAIAASSQGMQGLVNTNIVSDCFSGIHFLISLSLVLLLLRGALSQGARSQWHQ